MRIGIGLPNPVPGTSGRTLIDWARRAEERGFSSLATIDRIVYPSYESLIALAAAAAVTERIGLITNVLLGPTRHPVLLAKEAASVDQLSSGRLTLGVAVGGRKDDFDILGVSFSNRGRRWDKGLETMHRVWRGEAIDDTSHPAAPSPTRNQKVPILIGGNSDAAVDRTVQWGIGWTAGGGGPDQVAPMIQRVRQAWQAAGREGNPRIVALTYFALTDDASDPGAAYLRHYYGAAPWVEMLVTSLLRTPDAIRTAAQRFEAIGVDELIFDPTVATLDQIDRLADAVL